MRMYKIRGQISLELMLLMLAVLLGAVIVGGIIVPNNLFNITSVEDTKEILFRGFVEGGGVSVSFSGNDNFSNNGTTEASNAGNNESNNEYGTNIITNESIAGSLELTLKGNSISYITSDVIPGGEPISGDINVTIHGNKIK